jgi:hypothetical protein
MITLTDYVLGAMATFYLAYCITSPEVDGPWEVFCRLRGRWNDPNDWRARGIRCVVCVSCWTALLITITLGVAGHIAWLSAPVVWLAMATGSILIEKGYSL